MSDMIPIIAIELAGVIGNRVIGTGNTFIPYQWRVVPGAAEALDLISRRCYVLIHTYWLSEETGVDMDAQARAIKLWLVDHKLSWDWLWTLPGKPWADRYVDNTEGLKDVIQTISDEIGEDRSAGRSAR